MIIKHKKELIFKHKDTKEQSFSLDTKTTSDLKVATKPCGLQVAIKPCGLQVAIKPCGSL